MIKIGSLENCIEFEDLNENIIESRKPYYNMILRCDENELLFKYLDKIISKNLNVKYELYQNYELFKSHLNQDMASKGKKYDSDYFDSLEIELKEEVQKIKDQIKLNTDSLDNYLYLLEFKFALDKLLFLFNTGVINFKDYNNQINNEDEILNENIIRTDSLVNTQNITYITGFCKTEDEMKISRMIFRTSKDRAIPSFFDIDYQDIKNEIIKTHLSDKKLFLVFVQGKYLPSKIKKILNIYNCSILEMPHGTKFKDEIDNIKNELNEKEKFLNEGRKILNNLLLEKIQKVGNFLSIFALYRMYFKVQKLMYTNLNKCKDYSNFLEGEVWIPEIYYEKLNIEIESLLKENDSIMLPRFYDFKDDKIYIKNFRTFFRINDFTYPFQEIVNTYGIPRYKEMNPGFFTIITFPFLFGIMFGDIGHGIILFSFGIYICLKYENLNNNSNSIIKEILPFRYIILLMGFFSLFCGLLYNDFMGIPLSIFNSCYINKNKIVEKKNNCVYYFGMDPKWYISKNELAFFNSLKMKFSVIIGVIQMTLGIILRGLNNIYFNDLTGFLFEFIPQICFMLLLFGYMIILIFVKWAINYDNDTSKAPSIITILMNLFLKNGSVEKKPVWGTVKKEESANRIFFYSALLCIPIILIPKPLIKILKMQKKEKKQNNDLSESLIENVELDDEEEEIKIREIPETYTDIIVHQIIETIEFVLGCVSNTASYLRLWALSLAHSQLAKVFFEKCILYVGKNLNFIGVIIGFFLFANITFSVLMGMDLMEAFLHTLRLHWVEFQNKFYYADGILFKAFSFQKLMDESQEIDEEEEEEKEMSK